MFGVRRLRPGAQDVPPEGWVQTALRALRSLLATGRGLGVGRAGAGYLLRDVPGLRGVALGEGPRRPQGRGAGTVVLLVILVLNVYKPRGMTRFGWSKRDEQRRALEP